MWSGLHLRIIESAEGLVYPSRGTNQYILMQIIEHSFHVDAIRAGRTTVVALSNGLSSENLAARPDVVGKSRPIDAITVKASRRYGWTLR